MFDQTFHLFKHFFAVVDNLRNKLFSNLYCTNFFHDDLQAIKHHFKTKVAPRLGEFDVSDVEKTRLQAVLAQHRPTLMDRVRW